MVTGPLGEPEPFVGAVGALVGLHATSVSSSETFLWFVDRDALMKCFHDRPTDVAVLGDGEDGLAKAARVSAAVDECRSLSFDEVVAKFAVLLEDVVSVPWIGVYDDLLVSSDEVAKRVRSSFRESEGETDSDAPITGDEEDGFLEFVSSFGC